MSNQRNSAGSQFSAPIENLDHVASTGISAQNLVTPFGNENRQPFFCASGLQMDCSLSLKSILNHYLGGNGWIMIAGRVLAFEPLNEGEDASVAQNRRRH